VGTQVLERVVIATLQHKVGAEAEAEAGSAEVLDVGLTE
jgi:hypothetical protein